MRTPDEIEAQLRLAGPWVLAGKSSLRSFTYEEGIDAALRWVTGASDVPPMEPPP